jgi:hypothetical protein
MNLRQEITISLCRLMLTTPFRSSVGSIGFFSSFFFLSIFFGTGLGEGGGLLQARVKLLDFEFWMSGTGFTGRAGGKTHEGPTTGGIISLEPRVELTIEYI